MTDASDKARNFNSEIDRANMQFGRMFPRLDANLVGHERMTVEELAEYNSTRPLPSPNPNWRLIAIVVYDPKEHTVEYEYPAKE